MRDETAVDVDELGGRFQLFAFRHLLLRGSCALYVMAVRLSDAAMDFLLLPAPAFVRK